MPEIAIGVYGVYYWLGYGAVIVLLLLLLP